MTFFFHPDAEVDFFEAINYYEECRFGLGYDFSIEVYSTIEKIVSFPEAWPVVENGIRRCLTNRFPYGLLYNYNSDKILILAVMHLHREPEYWIQRV